MTSTADFARSPKKAGYCVLMMLAVAAPVLAQPARLEQVGVVPGPAEMVRIQGTRAYAALGRTLTVFDVANPAAPRRVGAHTFPDKIWGVTEAGGLVYAAVDKYGLAILDASGPAGLALRGSFKTPGQAKSVALVGTTALVADHMSGVDFIDVSNPAKPASLGSFFLEGYARAVAAAGFDCGGGRRTDRPLSVRLHEGGDAGSRRHGAIGGPSGPGRCDIDERQFGPKCRRAGRVWHSADLRHLRAGGASKGEHLPHAGRASRARDAAKLAGLRGRPRGWARDCGSRGARVTSRCRHLQNADAGA